MESTLYQVLGIEPGATQKQIRSAFRRLAKAAHPDTNGGNPLAAERFKEIVAAYRILSCEEARRRYDEGLAVFRKRWTAFDEKGTPYCGPRDADGGAFESTRAPPGGSRGAARSQTSSFGRLPGRRAAQGKAGAARAYSSTKPSPSTQKHPPPPPRKAEPRIGFFRTLIQIVRCLVLLLFGGEGQDRTPKPVWEEKTGAATPASFQDFLSQARDGGGCSFRRGPDGIIRRSRSPASSGFSTGSSEAVRGAVRSGALGMLAVFLAGLWHSLTR